MGAHNIPTVASTVDMASPSRLVINIPAGRCTEPRIYDTMENQKCCIETHWS
jgi:hypothetical protein